MVRSKVRVEGRRFSSTYGIVSRWTNQVDLDPHTPTLPRSRVEVELKVESRGGSRSRVKLGARGRASWSKLVVEARGWGSRSMVDDEAWPVWRYRNCLIEGACCAIQVPNTKSQTKNPRYIHRTKQYSYMFKMNGDTTLENPLGKIGFRRGTDANDLQT